MDSLYKILTEGFCLIDVNEADMATTPEASGLRTLQYISAGFQLRQRLLSASAAIAFSFGSDCFQLRQRWLSASAEIDFSFGSDCFQLRQRRLSASAEKALGFGFVLAEMYCSVFRPGPEVLS